DRADHLRAVVGLLLPRACDRDRRHGLQPDRRRPARPPRPEAAVGVAPILEARGLTAALPSPSGAVRVLGGVAFGVRAGAPPGTRRRESARRAALELFADVGLPPERVLGRYPHELSGGMCQRMMIAYALASRPSMLIADEPTTALDVTIQLQIIELLSRLREEHGLTLVLITHNLSVVAELCDRVVVMYLGKIVEEGPVLEIFDRPKHPYT